MDDPDLVLVLQAFMLASDELDQLDATPMPMPDALEDLAVERNAACAVLRRVLRAAPPDRKRRLGAMIREELEAALHEPLVTDTIQLRVPTLPEVVERVRRVGDELERRARSDLAFADAYREARR